MTLRKNQRNASERARPNGHANGGADRGRVGVNGKGNKSTEAKAQDVQLDGPTDFAAMQDGAAYVDAVAVRVNLVAASARLLRSGDDKVAKAELDRLRDMKFGKVGPAANVPDAPTVIWDAPGANVSRNEG